jgi:hypothetical protein
MLHTILVLLGLFAVRVIPPIAIILLIGWVQMKFIDKKYGKK